MRERPSQGSPKAAGRAALDFGHHLASGLVSPYATATQAIQKGIGPVGAIRDQALDIRNPSGPARKYEANIAKTNQKQAVQNFKKPGNPVSALYDRMLGY